MCCFLRCLIAVFFFTDFMFFSSLSDSRRNPGKPAASLLKPFFLSCVRPDCRCCSGQHRTARQQTPGFPASSVTLNSRFFRFFARPVLRMNPADKMLPFVFRHCDDLISIFSVLSIRSGRFSSFICRSVSADTREKPDPDPVFHGRNPECRLTSPEFMV